MVASPRTQVRMMEAPLLCSCLWSQMCEEQGLVLKCPRGTGTVLASVGCWVWNSLCQGSTPGVVLVTLANCSGFFPSWVELRADCFRSHPSGTACMELAPASPSLPRNTGDGQCCSAGNGAPWILLCWSHPRSFPPLVQEKAETPEGFCPFSKDARDISGNFLKL